MLSIGNPFGLLYTSSTGKASYFSNCFTNLSVNYEEGVNKLKRQGVLNAFQLKLIALVTMTIDHTAGALGYDELGKFYRPMRNLGRMAFPIYCFLLVEGYLHTRNVNRYLWRLMIAFALSELPFDLALYRKLPAPKANVMITLLLGLLTVLLLDRSGAFPLRREEDSEQPMRPALCRFLVFAGMGAAFLLQTDYRGGGVLLIVLFYLFRGQFWALWTMIPPVLLIFYNPYELWGACALLLVALYNGEPGPRPGGKAGQWFFYLYYPLHLGLLAVIRTVVFHVPMEVFGVLV